MSRREVDWDKWNDIQRRETMNAFVSSIVNGLGLGIGFVAAVAVMKVLFHTGLC